MAAYTTSGEVGPPCSIVTDSWQGLQRLATIHLDFSLPGKRVNKLCLKVCIVHSSFTEFASIAVVFPVVMPVSPTVCTKAKNIHLREKTKRYTHRLMTTSKQDTAESAKNGITQRTLHSPRRRHGGRRTGPACQWRDSGRGALSIGHGCI